MAALEVNAHRKLMQEDWQCLGPELPPVAIPPEHSNSHLSHQPLSSQREKWGTGRTEAMKDKRAKKGNCET